MKMKKVVKNWKSFFFQKWKTPRHMVQGKQEKKIERNPWNMNRDNCDMEPGRQNDVQFWFRELCWHSVNRGNKCEKSNVLTIVFVEKSQVQKWSQNDLECYMVKGATHILNYWHQGPIVTPFGLWSLVFQLLFVSPYGTVHGEFAFFEKDR